MKCTKIYNARAQPLFCSLNPLFSDVAVALAPYSFCPAPELGIVTFRYKSSQVCHFTVRRVGTGLPITNFIHAT